MTVDEDFTKLEDDIRRLKVEYEIFFNGSSPRPPHDTLFRVETTIKRYASDQSKLNFGQRYRLTNLLQKYAIHSALWRRRLQEKEEGRSLTGYQKRPITSRPDDGTVRVVCSDPDAETEKVSQLLQAMREARKKVGESTIDLDGSSFHRFIKAKTKQLQETLGCVQVQYSVSVEDGKVKFKASKAG